MTGQPPGSVVGIYVDTRATIAVGDLIRTITGRTYEVVEARRPTRGTRMTTRWMLRVLVLPNGVHDDGAPVHTIRWYRR